MCSESPIYILYIDETKLDSSYLDGHLEIPGYQYSPYRKGRKKNEGNKIVFIREDFWQRYFRNDLSRSNIPRKFWFINYVYLPPYNNSKGIFSSKLSNTLNVATKKYENILIIGDLDTSNRHFKQTKKVIGTTYPIYVIHSRRKTDITCVKSTNITSTNVLLKNKSRRFHHTFEIDVRDCHKVILTFFKAYFKKLFLKNIE